MTENKKNKKESVPWNNLDFEFDQIESVVNEMVNQMLEKSEEKDNQPVVMGFVFKIGEDGKPITQEFSNSAELETASKEVEPLVETRNLKKMFLVTVSLPGIKKEEIDLQTNSNSITISAWNQEQYYVKHVRLPEEILSNQTKARFKNSILEIELPKKTVVKGKKIRIE